MSIEGLKGREPVGAVLTIGHKGPKGAPEQTDRFYLVVPQEVDGVRAKHPAYSLFNQAEPERRQLIRGNLVHASIGECFEYNRRAQNLPGLGHPMKAPSCSGDGVRASRWDGKEFKEIPCPGDKCQFAQSTGDKPTPCKPFMRLLFRIRWPDGNPLPSMLVKFTSGSWNTTKNIVGFFDHIEAQAINAGVEDYTLYGFPFQLLLMRKKVAGRPRAFPIVSITPEVDVTSFLFEQRRVRRELGPAESLLDASQRSTIEAAADVKSISGPVLDVEEA